MRNRFCPLVLVFVIMFSLVSCSTHKYDAKEIEERLNVASLESREVYCGKEWGHLTYYFTLDSFKYEGIYFYLFDSSREAKEFYDYDIESFDTITNEEDNYVIGDMHGGEVIDHLCIFVTDNMVVHIDMSADYFDDQSNHSHVDTRDIAFVESLVQDW